MKFQNFKRLIAEDFDSSQQSLIQKISAVINPLVDQLNTALNKQLDFSNLNQQVVTFKTEVSATGVPTSPLQLTSNLVTAVQGIQVMNCVNQTDSSLFTGAVQCFFTRKSNTVTISQITGLLPKKTYSITVNLIG